MKIDLINKNPIVVLTIGLLIVFAITGCQSPKTPAEIAIAFWSAIAKNDLDQANKLCTTQSQSLLTTSQLDNFQTLIFDYGKIVIEGDQATVEIQITQAQNNTPAFTTFLLKEDNHWKIDCQRSTQEIINNPIKDLFESLNKLGNTVNKQLEQQLPLIEKEIESFGKALKQQLDNFGKNLKKPTPQKQTNPYQNSI